MSSDQVTAVLAAAREPGVDVEANELLDRLVSLVYDELRGMAHRQLAGGRDGRTLDTTCLVHEAYLKLVDHTQVVTNGRGYFFAAASRAMRQVLVDAARRRDRLKRGGGHRPATLDETVLGVDDCAVEVLELEEALERLGTAFPRAARVVECRYFGGLTVEETAEALQISLRTVKRDWNLARAWLFDALRETR